MSAALSSQIETSLLLLKLKYSYFFKKTKQKSSPLTSAPPLSAPELAVALSIKLQHLDEVGTD